MGVDRNATIPASAIVIAAAADSLPIAVVGAHLTGMPLNHELTSLGGVMVEASRTDHDYRLYVLPKTTPPKPGLIREPGFVGPGLAIEVWMLPLEGFGRFVAKIPAPLGIGKVTLENGSSVSCFLCEAHAVAGAEEITSLGGWRNYISSKSSP
jgi:allophanate hydrolase